MHRAPVPPREHIEWGQGLGRGEDELGYLSNSLRCADPHRELWDCRGLSLAAMEQTVQNGREKSSAGLKHMYPQLTMHILAKVTI